MSSVTVKPGILAWARETMGISQEDAAQKVRADLNTFQEWEAGRRSISLSKLKFLANLYKRSLAVFFLPEVPNAPIFPPDFRTLDSIKTEELSQKVRLAVRKAQRNRKIMAELTELLDEPRGDFFTSHTLREDPETLAGLIRERFNVSLEDQFGWSDKAKALKGWVAVMERNGVLVSQTSLPIDEMRAFCLRGSNLPPAIVLNSSDDEKARIFSLWHEFAHLLLSDSEIHRVRTTLGAERAYSRFETFANRFAGAFLVPARSLLQNKHLKAYLESKSDTYLVRIAGKYKVSSDVVLRRMLILNLIEEEFYQEKKLEFDERNARLRHEEEKRRRSDERPSGFQTPSQKAFASAGVVLTSKVFEAQGRGVISPADVAGYFEVKTKHFKKIQELLDKRLSQ